MIATILALATSMFWFPAPTDPDPKAAAFLEAERQYLLGQWNLTKGFFAILVPGFFAVIGFAFWHRSIWLGLLAINSASLTKVGWSFHFGGDSGWTVVAPALTGLAVINILGFFALRRAR